MPQMMPGEHPIRVARQHWTIFIPVGLVCTVALVVGLVLLAVTPSTVSGHDLGEAKVLIGLGLVLLSGVFPPVEAYAVLLAGCVVIGRGLGSIVQSTPGLKDHHQ